MAAGMDNFMTDEIIKRRLLVDGDGVGDDRKLMSLTKAYVAWVSSNSRSTSNPEKNKATYRSLVNQISQVELSMRRTHEAILVNQQTKSMFNDLKGDVQAEIEQTKEQIVDSKNLLEEATKHRKYSMEYDALAKLIQSKPDRKGTEGRKVQLQNDLQALKNRQTGLDKKLEERKKNLCMMSSTIERLKELLDEEVNEPEPVSPMYVTEPDLSNPCSPCMQQIPCQEDTSLKNISGVVTSVPLSPSRATPRIKSEKYEDLSESEGEQT